MKLLQISAVMCVFLIGAVTGVQAKNFDDKVGFVDLSRLFDEYEKTKEYDQVLEEAHNSFEADRNTKIEEIRDEQGKLALLKEEEREKLEAELEQKKEALLEYDRQQRTELTKKRDERVREILLEIEKLVSDYAAEEDFGLILNDRVLIFGDTQYDLTDIILEKLNDSYNKSK